MTATSGVLLLGLRFGAYYFGERDSSIVIPYETDDSWTSHRFVAHALGAVGDSTYSNSREAFVASYQAGFRVFEVDLVHTSDGHLVARHGWPDEPATLEDFRAEGSGVLTAREVVQLVESHSDVYVILDIKDDFAAGLAAWVELASGDVLARTVPQLFRERDLSAALALYPFPSFVYTLYRTRSPHWAVSRFLDRSGVSVLTVSRLRFRFARRLVEGFDGFVYVHTVNSPAAFAAYLGNGAHGVYTDLLAPDRFTRR